MPQEPTIPVNPSHVTVNGVQLRVSYDGALRINHKDEDITLLLSESAKTQAVAQRHTQEGVHNAINTLKAAGFGITLVGESFVLSEN